MAEEERDIYFGTPPEIVEFAKKLVPKMAGMMALMAKAVYEATLILPLRPVNAARSGLFHATCPPCSAKV